MEGGNECLCLLRHTYWPLSLDCDDWGVGRGCLSNSGVLLRTKSGDMSFLVALKTESALDPLSFFFVRKCGTSPYASNVHGIWVMIAERVSPLRFSHSPPSVGSLDSFF